ncbi:HAD hydrolase family protein, partial [Bacillus sp. JJ722]|uniref:HAD hydrolase family protein n=1 Tax=Bacillus sp. JJ722 TaxID=3122973 RepID=UPI002FFDFA16
EFLDEDLKTSHVDEDFFWKSIRPQIEQQRLALSQSYITPYVLGPVVKFIVVTPHKEKLEKLKCLVNTLTPIMSTQSNQFNLELGCTKISRERAIQDLIKKCNIPLQNCYVIGANQNDLGLFTYFENGIAMQSAIPPIKQLANFETYNNNNGGVSHTINNYIL